MAMAKNDFHFKDSPPSSSSSSPISSYNGSGGSAFDSPASPDRFGSTGSSHTPPPSTPSHYGNGASAGASNGSFSTPPSGFAPVSIPQPTYGAPSIPQGTYGVPSLPQGGSSAGLAPIPTTFGNPFLDPSKAPSTPAPVLKFGTLTGQPTMPAPLPPGVADVCVFSLFFFFFSPSSCPLVSYDF